MGMAGKAAHFWRGLLVLAVFSGLLEPFGWQHDSSAIYKFWK